MKNWKIYVLKEPDGETVRYVGYTGGSLDERLNQHIRQSRRAHTHKSDWIKSILKKKQLPIIELIEEHILLDKVDESEINYIKMFKSCGANLTNATGGGYGVKNPSAETRKKCSEIKKKFYEDGGKPWNLDKPHSAETKEKISKSKIGTYPDVKTREKLSRIHIEFYKNQKHKILHSERMKLWWSERKNKNKI